MKSSVIRFLYCMALVPLVFSVVLRTDHARAADAPCIIQLADIVTCYSARELYQVQVHAGFPLVDPRRPVRMVFGLRLAQVQIVHTGPLRAGSYGDNPDGVYFFFGTFNWDASTPEYVYGHLPPYTPVRPKWLVLWEAVTTLSKGDLIVIREPLEADTTGFRTWRLGEVLPGYRQMEIWSNERRAGLVSLAATMRRDAAAS